MSQNDSERIGNVDGDGRLSDVAYIAPDIDQGCLNAWLLHRGSAGTVNNIPLGNGVERDGQACPSACGVVRCVHFPQRSAHLLNFLLKHLITGCRSPFGGCAPE